MFVTPTTITPKEDPTTPFKEIRPMVAKNLLPEFNVVEPIRVYEKEGREHTTFDRISFLHYLLTNCTDGRFYSLPGNKSFYYLGDIVEVLAPFSVFYFRENMVVDGKQYGTLYCYTKQQANTTPFVPLMQLEYPAHLLSTENPLPLLEVFREANIHYHQWSQQIAQVRFFYRRGVSIDFEIFLTKRFVPQVIVTVEDRVYVIHHLHRSSTIREICAAIGCLFDAAIDITDVDRSDPIDFSTYVETDTIDMPLTSVDARSIHLYTIAFLNAMR
jgi:hypothetical protein